MVANAAEADDMSWAVLAGEVRRLRSDRPLLVLLNQRNVPGSQCLPVDEALDRLGVEVEPSVHAETLASSSDIAAAEAGLAWLAGSLSGIGSPDALPADGEEAAVVPPPNPGVLAPRGMDAAASIPLTPRGSNPLYAALRRPLAHDDDSDGNGDSDGSDGNGGAPGGGDGSRDGERQRHPPTRLRVVQALRDARQFAGAEAELAAALAQKLASGHLLSSEELAKLRRSRVMDADE